MEVAEAAYQPLEILAPLHPLSPGATAWRVEPGRSSPRGS